MKRGILGAFLMASALISLGCQPNNGSFDANSSQNATDSNKEYDSNAAGQQDTGQQNSGNQSKNLEPIENVKDLPSPQDGQAKEND